MIWIPPNGPCHSWSILFLTLQDRNPPLESPRDLESSPTGSPTVRFLLVFLQLRWRRFVPSGKNATIVVMPL